MARILIIEDNPANMKLACLLMGNVGHAVVCAVDAESGLTLARAEQPDLILMDIQLPGMDGFAATALLKQDQATASIPVIALTSMAMKEDQEKSHVAGCDAYIAKPLRYQELYAAIDALLTARNPSAVEMNPFADSPIAAALALEDVPTPPSNMSEAVFEPLPHPQPARNGGLILVAEDNETNQDLIRLQLALLGFDAEVAGNGYLALQRWQVGNYALLLSDLQMPEMDGYQLTAAIRSQEHGARRIPIVALTANALKSEADDCRAAGMDDYLSKPLQLSDLKATLDKWLPAATSDRRLHGVATSQEDSAQAVQVRVLEGLVGNDPAVIQEFLRDFRISAAKIALGLKTACANGQPVQASEQAHKLMSSARSVGALALGELCAEMVTAGNAGRTETLTALFPLFEQELKAVGAYLDSLQA